MKRIVALIGMACITLPVVAMQADASDVDEQIVGSWQLTMTTPEGESLEPIVLIGRQYDEYVAWYVGEDGLEAIKGVQLKDDALVGTIKPKEHPGVTVALEARLSGDTACKGVGKYRTAEGESGSWTFSGKRVALTSFGEVSTWQLSFVTPDYERHSATVSVLSTGTDLHAWYDGKDHKLPAQEIRVNGDQITMNVSAETRDGTNVDLTFRGTVDGDKINGDAEYRMDGDTGSFPFTARRSS